MSELTRIFIFLAISIVVILFSILKIKLSPVISLIFGSLVMGLGSKLGLVDTMTLISSGFGNLLAGIGLPIGLGVILGKLLEESGGAQVIAETLVSKAGKKYSLYALGLAGFILSVPVFFDITFIILIPIAMSLSKTLNKPRPYAIGTITIGAATAHTLVPPTPNPLAAGEILGFDTGIMVIAGLLVGLLASMTGMFLYIKILDKGFWKKEEDENGIFDDSVGQSKELPKGSPSFWMAMLPIIIPVLCIIAKTGGNAFGIESPIIDFFSDKTIAMLLGALAAYIISKKALGKNIEDISNKALDSAGMVILVTGAGGSFGSVISGTGFADKLIAEFGGMDTSPLVIVLLGFALALIFRVALGSGTVASITSMNIMAGFATATSLHPVFIAMACLAGGMSIGHVNDSGYWVVTNMSGFTVKGGLKTYTLAGIWIALVTLIICIIAALFA